mgnify:CR=1 FL=1
MASPAAQIGHGASITFSSGFCAQILSISWSGISRTAVDTSHFGLTDGTEFGFAGTFREVRPGEKLVHTEGYDPGDVGGGFPGKEALVTVSFAEHAGITTVTSLIDFGSKESRDAAVATGMTSGMEQSYQLLDRLLGEQG